MYDKTRKRLGKEMATIQRELTATPTPEFWADVLNDVLKGGPDVTPWFPASQTPTRRGWYQRFVWTALESHFWDGASWLVSPRGKKYDRSIKMFWPCWRGLSRESTPQSRGR